MKNERGNTLLNVLIIFTLIVTGAALLYPLIIQSTSEQERAYRQLQTINVANSAMETLIESDQPYATSVVLPDSNRVDLEATKNLDPDDNQKVIYQVNAYFGDKNSNKEKDFGERYFYKKVISTVKSNATSGKTKKPTLSIVEDNLYITVENCQTTLQFYYFTYNENTQTYEQGSQIINSNLETLSCVNNVFTMNLSILTNTSPTGVAIDGLEMQTYGITATEIGKEPSDAAILTLPSDFDGTGDGGGEGLVKKIINGVETYHGIEQVIESPGALIVLSGTNFDGMDLINFKAENDIIVQDGAILTTSNSGQASITFTSTSGNIIIEGSLTNEANSNNLTYDILLDAQDGDLIIDKAEIEAERQIHLKGNNISAKEAFITTHSAKDNKNDYIIMFYLSGKLAIDDLTLKYVKNDTDQGQGASAGAYDKNSTSTQINKSNICGILLMGTINEESNFQPCTN